MFVDITVVVEKPRGLFCVTIHYLKILLFTESDDRSHNVGKAKGGHFSQDVYKTWTTPNFQKEIAPVKMKIYRR